MSPHDPAPCSDQNRLDRLARGVAHDLKNQLTAILGNLSLVLPKLPPDSPQAPILREIELSAEQAVVLADQLHIYAGVVRLDPAPVELGGLAREMVRLLRGALPPGASLELQLADEPTRALADGGKIRESLMHLILNAAAALGESPSEGRVALRTGRAPAELGSLVVDGRQPGASCVFLEVTDNGRGMSADTLAVAFDPYFSTRRGSKGIGLAFVAGVVRGHQGAIGVSSTPGKGTAVRLYLPMIDPGNESHTGDARSG